MIDWMLVATIAAVLAPIIVGITAYVMNRLRTSDWTIIRGLKSDSDQRIDMLDSKLNTLDSRIADVYTNVQAKLDKTEHQIALARIDKEMESLRRDTKADFIKIDSKLDRMMDLMMNFFTTRPKQ